MVNQEGTLKAFAELIAVVEELRGEHGCPWDKAQTHGSLRMQLIEEAYEAADAMLAYEEKQEAENLKEELGDILLQVIFHGVMGEEEHSFTIEEVVRGITEKMIHRHPHVFSRELWEKQEAKKSWEQLKAEEKGGTNQTPLREIPKSLPALLKAAKVLKKTDTIYGAKIEKEESLAKLISLVNTLQQAEGEEQKELMADLLYQLCNIAWQDKLNLEELLLLKTEEGIETWEPGRKEFTNEEVENNL